MQLSDEFTEQEQHLNSIPKEDLLKLVKLFDTMKRYDGGDEFTNSDAFHQLHKMLYNLMLIFDFDWMAWRRGWTNIKDVDFDYSCCSLLDISMYLTAIFRADRFSEGAIEHNIRNGTLDKIFNRLRG